MSSLPKISSLMSRARLALEAELRLVEPLVTANPDDLKLIKRRNCLLLKIVGLRRAAEKQRSKEASNEKSAPRCFKCEKPLKRCSCPLCPECNKRRNNSNDGCNCNSLLR